MELLRNKTTTWDIEGARWVGGDEIDDDPLSAEIDLGTTLVQGNGYQTHPAHTYTHTQTNPVEILVLRLLLCKEMTSKHTHTHIHTQTNQVEILVLRLCKEMKSKHTQHTYTHTNQSSRDFGTFRLLLCKEVTYKHNQRHTQTNQTEILVLLLCKEKKTKHTHTHTQTPYTTSHTCKQ
jgi:hypothetical protein